MASNSLQLKLQTVVSCMIWMDSEKQSSKYSSPQSFLSSAICYFGNVFSVSSIHFPGA